MPRNVLLILAETTEGSAVRRALINSRDGPFHVEWVSLCGDALERLGREGEEDFAAIVVDLFLPDSQGIEPSSAPTSQATSPISIRSPRP
jgi:hypothetical protein